MQSAACTRFCYWCNNINQPTNHKEKENMKWKSRSKTTVHIYNALYSVSSFPSVSICTCTLCIYSLHIRARAHVQYHATDIMKCGWTIYVVVRAHCQVCFMYRSNGKVCKSFIYKMNIAHPILCAIYNGLWNHVYLSSALSRSSWADRTNIARVISYFGIIDFHCQSTFNTATIVNM